jgi:hypothetical protein
MIDWRGPRATGDAERAANACSIPASQASSE